MPSGIQCEHMPETEIDWVHSDQDYLDFLKNFKEATFVGVPDKILELSDLTSVKKLTWKRLMPREILGIELVPYRLACPKLKHLRITTRLTEEVLLYPMPRVYAPALVILELHALPGSTKVWDIPSVFFKDRPGRFLTKVHIEQDRVLGQTPMEFPLFGLELIAGSVEDLTVRGYIPSFVCGRNIAWEQLIYSSLWGVKRLDVDITNMPMDHGEDSPNSVSLRVSKTLFPVLLHLHLHIADPTVSGLHNGEWRVLVEVLPRVNTLSMGRMTVMDKCIIQGQTLRGDTYGKRVYYEKFGGVWTRTDGSGAV